MALKKPVHDFESEKHIQNNQNSSIKANNSSPQKTQHFPQNGIDQRICFDSTKKSTHGFWLAAWLMPQNDHV